MLGHLRETLGIIVRRMVWDEPLPRRKNDIKNKGKVWKTVNNAAVNLNDIRDQEKNCSVRINAVECGGRSILRKLNIVVRQRTNANVSIAAGIFIPMENRTESIVAMIAI